MAEAQKILIIRPSALGDVSRTVPALVTLRQAFPQARIDWLVQDSYVDVIRHHPALTGVVPFPRARFRTTGRNISVTREFFAWAKKLRQTQYDLVYDLQGLFRSGFFAWLTRADKRVGPRDARELGWLGYTHRLDAGHSPHTVDCMLGLLEADGLKTVRDLRLHVGDEDRQWFAKWRDENHLTGKTFATIAPTAKWLCKCWPMERYAQLAKKIIESGRVGQKIVVLAAPSEQNWLKPLVEAFGTNSPLIFPRTTVGQMMAILQSTSLLVCNDSAPLHIAVGFGKPIVTIFGPTDPQKVGPYRRPEIVVAPAGMDANALRYRARPDDQSLISQVTLDEVWQRTLEQLEQTPREPVW